MWVEPPVPIIVFARVPEPGRSKTRLIPRLGPAGAAALGEAMTRDVLDFVRASRLPARVVVAGDLQHPWVRTLPLPWEPQAEGDLGARLAHALRDGGVAIGTDAPTLPPSFLRAAQERLPTEGQVVFGPAFDGGYTLVGARDPSGLFDGIPWSSPGTYAASYARARALGRQVQVLPFWYDVDEPDDLDLLSHHLSTLPDDVAPATRQFLRENPLLP